MVCAFFVFEVMKKRRIEDYFFVAWFAYAQQNQQREIVTFQMADI